MAQYEGRVVRFLWRRLGNGSDAEDVGQQVFIKAYRNLHRVEASRPFGPWIFTLARRESISFLRKKRLVNLAMWVRRPVSPSDQFATSENTQSIWEVAREVLKPDPFTALWLSIENDCSIREIADSLDKSESAVKVILHRARKQLQNALEETGHPGLTECQPEWEYHQHETRI